MLCAWLALPVQVQAQAPEPPAAPAKPDLTKEQIDATAQALQERLVPMGMDIQNILNSGNVRSFEGIFSRQIFAFNVMKGIDYGEKLSPELSKALGDAANLGILFYQWDPMARFKFMHVRAVEDRLGLFMRCVHANGSVSYFTFFLDAAPEGGGLRVVDVYTHRAAMARSTAARQYVVQQAVSQGLLHVSKIHLDISPLDIRKFSEMSNALKNNNLPAVNSIYLTMSPEAQDKPYAIMIHMAANLENNDSFKADYDKMNRIAPKELAQDLMLTDQLTSQGKWDEAIAALKVLDVKVGGDAYLTLKMARCEYEKGDRAAAGKAAIEAIKMERDLHAAYMLLLDIEVDKKNYEGAFKMLKLMADEFGLVITPEEFGKTDDYKGFRESDAFAKWKEYAAKKQQELKSSTGETSAPQP